jgi:hypothetical protein
MIYEKLETKIFKTNPMILVLPTWIFCSILPTSNADKNTLILPGFHFGFDPFAHPSQTHAWIVDSKKWEILL